MSDAWSRAEHDADIYRRMPLSDEEVLRSSMQVWPDDEADWDEVFGFAGDDRGVSPRSQTP